MSNQKCINCKFARNNKPKLTWNGSTPNVKWKKVKGRPTMQCHFHAKHHKNLPFEQKKSGGWDCQDYFCKNWESELNQA